MAITGVQQPNELVVYKLFSSATDDQIIYARYSYAFAGLGSSGVALSPGEIITVARSPATGDNVSLPSADFKINDLSQTRVSVRRYDKQTQQARIVVEWGQRFSGGGAAPDVQSRSSSVVDVNYIQPYTAILPAVSGPVNFETRERKIPRVRTRVRIRTLHSDDADINSLDQLIEENVGKLFLYHNVWRILVGGGYSPFSQTQGYITTVFDRLGAVMGTAERGIIDDFTGHNLIVHPLAANELYKVPHGSLGTRATPVDESYVEGAIGVLWWLT